jgi:Leucine-rich repeat (LRR) protein
MKTLFKIFIPFFLLFTCGNAIFGQNVEFEKHVLNEPVQHKKELLSSFNLTEIPIYTPKTTSRKVILSNGYAQYKIQNPKDWSVLKKDNIATEIDIIYTKYPRKEEDWRTEYHGLLANRLKALFELDPSLNSLDITWNIILQTECYNEPQTKQLFHGIAIHYVPKQQIKTEIAILEDTTDTNKEIIIDEIPQDVLQDKPIEASKSLNENESDNTSVLERLKSKVPDEIGRTLEDKTDEEAIDIIYEYLTNQKTKLSKEEITPDFLKNRTQKVEKFIEDFSSMPHSEIGDMLNRQKISENTLVVMDWTGSMYGFGGEVMKWHLLNFKKSGIQNFVLFNDGDAKSTALKEIGSTGGIYMKDASSIDELLDLFELVMARGQGGDRPENDVEAILRGLKEYPSTKEVVLIADNRSCVRDIELVNYINVPVKVILCGYTDLMGANPQYIEIAARTKGSIHTAKQDIDKLNIEILKEKEDLELTRGEKTIITIRSECFVDYTNSKGYFTKKRTDEEPEFMRKVYYSMRKAMEKPDSVYRLNLATNNLEDVPTDVNRLGNLHHADFSYNNLTRISDEILDRQNLESLDLKKNQIKVIPKQLYSLENLVRLDLSHNEIKKLPKGIDLYPALQELYLNNNELKSVTEELAKLSRIRIMDISHNQITVLPEFYTGWRRVEKVVVSYNQLERLPLGLKECKRITYFDASHNQLSVPPVPIVGMRHLNYLDLSYNQLKDVPSGIGNLKELTKLNLSHNNIGVLNRRFGFATKLVELDLSHNQITKLPETFWQLRELLYLNLEGNPISDQEKENIKKMLPKTVIVFK